MTIVHPFFKFECLSCANIECGCLPELKLSCSVSSVVWRLTVLHLPVNLFQEGGCKLQALETELKAKEKEEAEAVASHKANHDSIVSEEKKKKQLEQGLHVV